MNSALQKTFTVLWRRPRFRRWFYSLLGLLFQRREEWRLMNCGHLPVDDPLGDLPAEWENEPLGFELYARLVAETPLAGLDVLEVGSGRGGGARFLHRLHAPREVVAADCAATAIHWCQKQFVAPGLEFVTARATALPFPPRSFDVVLSAEVEADSARRVAVIGHDVPAFLRPVARGFASTTGSSTFRQLREDRAVYLRHVLVRADGR